MVIGAAQVFDGTGVSGVWDVLDTKCGVKNVPKWGSIPWTLALNTGTLVTLYQDGKAITQLGTGSTQSADEAEKILQEVFSGKVVRAQAFSAKAGLNPQRIRYGEKSTKALAREEKPGFRSGGSSWHT